jgi:hypothetical protein
MQMFLPQCDQCTTPQKLLLLTRDNRVVPFFRVANVHQRQHFTERGRWITHKIQGKSHDKAREAQQCQQSDDDDDKKNKKAGNEFAQILQQVQSLMG